MTNPLPDILTGGEKTEPGFSPFYSAVVKSLGERYGIPKNRAKAFLWQRRGEESRNGPA